jgi:hypothetical protein
MNPLVFQELSLSAKASICWGFFWRGIVATLCSTVCGGLIGEVVGLVLGAIGIPIAIVKVIASVYPLLNSLLGLAVGAIALYLFLRWILASRLGSFRLVLVSADDNI